MTLTAGKELQTLVGTAWHMIQNRGRKGRDRNNIHWENSHWSSSTFNWHCSKPFQFRSIWMKSKRTLQYSWMVSVFLLCTWMLVWLVSSRIVVDNRQGQWGPEWTVCCFLLLLVLSYTLLTHCCYENLCRSMKKSFQVQEGNQCVRMHSCCNFVEWCLFKSE